MYSFTDIVQIDNLLLEKINETERFFYLLDTLEIIEEYKKILETPLVMSFFTTKDCKVEKTNERKQELIKLYLEKTKELLKKYKINYENSIKQEKKVLELEECSRCGKENLTESVEFQGIIICIHCGNQENIGKLKTSMKISHCDSERINICSKYTYEKKFHFINCIEQFQGKTKNIINEEVLNLIRKEMENYNLDNNSLSKEHILFFIKDLKLTKYYGDVNIIHNKLTGKKLHNISHLTEQLKQDFEQFVKVHYKLFPNETERKNFNYQQLLFQLLCRHKYPCSPSEFNFLKTVDRKSYHDDNNRQVFEELGWNYTSIF